MSMIKHLGFVFSFCFSLSVFGSEEAPTAPLDFWGNAVFVWNLSTKEAFLYEAPRGEWSVSPMKVFSKINGAVQLICEGGGRRFCLSVLYLFDRLEQPVDTLPLLSSHHYVQSLNSKKIRMPDALLFTCVIPVALMKTARVSIMEPFDEIEKDFESCHSDSSGLAGYYRQREALLTAAKLHAAVIKGIAQAKTTHDFFARQCHFPYSFTEFFRSATIRTPAAPARAICSCSVMDPLTWEGFFDGLGSTAQRLMRESEMGVYSAEAGAGDYSSTSGEEN